MYDYKNKAENIDLLNRYMLARTLTMFRYDGLPDTLPQVHIEKQLQKSGYTFITEVEGNLYAFQGGLGGGPGPYGEPTKISISNPALHFSKTLNIKTDGVLIKNDDLQIGLLPLYEKYNTLLIENEVTMYLNSINTRIQTLISAGDDATRESAELYIKKIIDGEIGIIGENRLFDGIKAQSVSGQSSNNTTQLIEFNQYLRATLFNEVGLNANFNMKRERLSSQETEMNTDALHPLLDNMLENRVDGLRRLNGKYNLDVSVKLGSIWKTRNISDKIDIGNDGQSLSPEDEQTAPETAPEDTETAPETAPEDDEDEKKEGA